MLQCSSGCTCSEGKRLQQQDLPSLQKFCPDWTTCSSGGRKNLPASSKDEKSIAIKYMQVPAKLWPRLGPAGGRKNLPAPAKDEKTEESKNMQLQRRKK